jgi:uncharacterized Ntn-hydrolase superfamily protein
VRKGTYSIVARDPASGDLGVAVQSHWFSVGSIVTWGRAGVGTVATQSIAEPAYGPRTLERLAANVPVAEALQGQLEADELAEVRQVAAVDATGAIAVHTGADCIPYASHVTGEQFSCQANMMARPGVPDAMAAAYAAADGDLAARLLAALEAAEEAGGDVRGRQSAAMVVVGPERGALTPKLELRIEDHADPIAELARLLALHRAYALAGEADEKLGAGATEEAARLYQRAGDLAPDSDELRFWAGLGMAESGDLDAGVAAVREAAATHPGWLDLLDRLTDELAPSAAKVRDALGRG